MEADAFGGGSSSSSVYRSRVAGAARTIVAAASASALPPAATQAAATAAATAGLTCDAANGTAAAPKSGQPEQPPAPPCDAQSPGVSAVTDGAGLLAQFEALQGRLAADDARAAVALLQQLGSTHVTAALLAETGALKEQQLAPPHHSASCGLFAH